MAKPNPNAKLGQGGRFAALKKDIATKGDVRDPGAVAAAIGRAKYGPKKMGQLSAMGKKSAHGSGSIDPNKGYRVVEHPPERLR